MKFFFKTLIIFFIFSCSDSKDKSFLQANLLVNPEYKFSDQFLYCNFNKGFNVLNLESFLSVFIEDKFIEDIDSFDLSVLFADSTNVNEFIFKLRNYSGNNIYETFIEKLSNKGFDEIASCKFNEEELRGYLVVELDKKTDNSSYISEILNCNYKEGYNFGTFRIALDRFVSEIKKQDILYEAEYLQNDKLKSSFIWINKYYEDNYLDTLSDKWITNDNASGIKEEFSENAICEGSKIYNSFLISKI